MTTPATAPSRPGLLPLVTAAVAALLHLVCGYFYLVSGLVAPGWAVLALLLWWLVLAFVGVRLALRRSYWVLAVPVVAAVTWVALMWFGGEVLGWTP